MNLKPIYVLTGTEPLLQRMFIEDLKAKVFPSGPQGFNDDQLDGRERSWAEIFDLANTFPMFADRRMITVRNASDFKAEDEKVWMDYLDNPPVHTVLVVQSDKLDKRKKVTKALDKSGFIHDLLPPKPAAMPGWVDKLASAKNIRVEPKARMALLDALGTNLTRVDLELDKLAWFVHPEQTVGDRAVAELVLKSSGDTIFEFTDQVMEGHTQEALTTLAFLMSEGTPALVILSMILRHVRILMKAKEALLNPKAASSLAQVLSVPPFLVQKYAEQSKRLSNVQLQAMLDRLLELDLDFKSTGLSERQLLERFILRT